MVTEEDLRELLAELQAVDQELKRLSADIHRVSRTMEGALGVKASHAPVHRPPAVAPAPPAEPSAVQRDPSSPGTSGAPVAVPGATRAREAMPVKPVRRRVEWGPALRKGTRAAIITVLVVEAVAAVLVFLADL